MKYILAITTFLLMISTSSAHEWYDGGCCSDKDCRPIVPGELSFTGTGWQFNPTGDVIELGQWGLKYSQDRRSHVCLNDENEVRCLYIPDPGS